MTLRIIVRLGTYAGVLLLLVAASVGLIAFSARISFADASWLALAGSVLFGGVLVASVAPIAEWLLRRVAPRYAAVPRQNDSVRELQLRARKHRSERRASDK